MITQARLTLKPRPKGFHLITEDILVALGELPETGLLNVFIQHTSAGLTVNENADRSVREDLDQAFDRLAPASSQLYTHNDEGADDMPAHIKSVIVGSSVTIPVTNKKLNLGTWQGIYICEFRERASARNLILTLYS